MSLLNDLEKVIVLRGKKAEVIGNASAFKKMSRLSSVGYIKQTRSGKAEAMLKVTGFARGHKVKVLMQYIARTDKEDLNIEDEQGNLYKDGEEIKELHSQWASDFERAAIGTGAKMDAYDKRVNEWERAGKKGKKPRKPKGAPRHATHVILSASTENSTINTWRTENAARSVLTKNLGQAGYEYVFVTHSDTKNPHVHVIIKNYNKELNKKLRLDKNDLFALRQNFAMELQTQGISQVATLRQDRPYTIEQMTSKLEELNNKQTWFQSKIKTNKSPQIDLDNIIRQQTRKIQEIEKKLKKADIPLKTKSKIAKELRDLKLELVNSRKNNLDIILSSKIKALGADAAYIKTGIKEISKIKENKASLSPASKKEIKLINIKVQKFVTIKNKQIAQARVEIKKSPLSKDDKKDLLSGLAVLSTKIKNYSKVNKLDTTREDNFMSNESKTNDAIDNIAGYTKQLELRKNDKVSSKHKMIEAIKQIQNNLKKASDPTLTIEDRAEAFTKSIASISKYTNFKKQAKSSLSVFEIKSLKNIETNISKMEKNTFSDIKKAAGKVPDINYKKTIKNITRLHNTLTTNLTR